MLCCPRWYLDWNSLRHLTHRISVDVSEVAAGVDSAVITGDATVDVDDAAVTGNAVADVDAAEDVTAVKAVDTVDDVNNPLASTKLFRSKTNGESRLSRKFP